MKGPLQAKLIAFVPEAAVFALLIAGVAYVVSGLGVQSRALARRSSLPAAYERVSSAEASASSSAHWPSKSSPGEMAVPKAAIHLAASKSASSSPVPAAAMMPPEPPELLKPYRVEHARELLGKFYDRSVVKGGEKVAEIGRFVRQWTVRGLSRKHQKFAKSIAEAVMAESERNSFDPVFLMAVIENESSFDPFVVGPAGEIGLMQITPATGEWIAKKYGIQWDGKKSLRDPKINIRIGAAYLAQLREEFDSHGQLYLAAYNMGSLNVNRALERSIWPKDYPQRVMKRYIKFYGDLKSEIKQETAAKSKG